MKSGNADGGKATTKVSSSLGTHDYTQRIAELAKTEEQMQFTSLAHLLNVETLKQCHQELPAGKAMGVLGVTKEQYQENLEENIADLVSRLKRGAYRPVPVQRAYIPKAGCKKQRPLGIPKYEDKIVQRAIDRVTSRTRTQ